LQEVPQKLNYLVCVAWQEQAGTERICLLVRAGGAGTDRSCRLLACTIGPTQQVEQVSAEHPRGALTCPPCCLQLVQLLVDMFDSESAVPGLLAAPPQEDILQGQTEAVSKAGWREAKAGRPAGRRADKSGARWH